MARIKPLNINDTVPSVQIAFERHLHEYGGILTNTKATLGYSLPAFEAYMQWYPLFQQTEKILGKKLALLFAYTISIASQCSLYSAFFRKQIIDSGENPDNITLTASQKAVLDFGCCITKYHGNIADHVFNSIRVNYTECEIITLIAFAGQMIAMNVFNNTTEIDMDDFLLGYLPETKYCQ